MSMTTERAHNGHNADTVLIVEDDAATRRLYKFLLSNGGYVVLEAEDGVAAVEVLQRHRCDLVMGLALLVYALAEHKLRTTLQEQGESVPNQAGKPTQRPTMRRIFQMFEGIDLLVIKTPEGVQQQVLNLKPVHRQILRLLGPNVEKCYLDSS